MISRKARLSVCDELSVVEPSIKGHDIDLNIDMDIDSLQ